MAGKTVEDLKLKLALLYERRTELAYSLERPSDKDDLTDLVLVHSAIAVMEAVIATGDAEPEGKSQLDRFKALS